MLARRRTGWGRVALSLCNLASAPQSIGGLALLGLNPSTACVRHLGHLMILRRFVFAKRLPYSASGEIGHAARLCTETECAITRRPHSGFHRVGNLVQ